jgi:hypothetical protein
MALHNDAPINEVASSIVNNVQVHLPVPAPVPVPVPVPVKVPQDVDQKENSDTDYDYDILIKGQTNRLQLLQHGLDPILSGPTDVHELEEILKNKDSEHSKSIISKYANDFSAWKYTLFARLDNIRIHCGRLCQLNSVEEIERHFDESKKGVVLPTVVIPDVDCDKIMGLEDIDAGDTTFPPIPDELQDFYTLNGAAHVHIDVIRKDAYLGGAAEKKLWKTGNVWNEDDINDAIEEVRAETLWGPYGVDETNNLAKSLSQIDMKDKSVLVIGSSHPWVEVVCLFLGAGKVTTLEYGEIISHHPQIVTYTPSSIRDKFLKGELEHFDGIITHSSVEHSGLGRYGDALNPWGDILAIARGWCMTKTNGFMWVSVPTGIDMIFSNWHRVYGRYRWPLLSANWRQIGQDVTFAGPRHFGFGPFKSMRNNGFLFEKIDPIDSDEVVATSKK